MNLSPGNLLLLPLAAMLATGCGDEPEHLHDEPTSLSIVFKPRVGGQDFACGRLYPGLGTSATSYEPKDFRLYIHNVRLLSHGTEVPMTLTDDGAWQHDGLALLDFEDKTGLCSNGTEATNDRLVGTAPAGHYTGLRFTVGVPFERNHQDVSTASAPLNVSTLFWSWAGGYKFLRLDGRTTGLPNGHNLHLGRPHRAACPTPLIPTALPSSSGWGWPSAAHRPTRPFSASSERSSWDARLAPGRVHGVVAGPGRGVWRFEPGAVHVAAASRGHR